MRRSGSKCIIFLALLIFVQFANANSLVRRRRDDDNRNWVEKLRDFCKDKVPIIGKLCAAFIQKGMDGWNKGQQLSDGALGRLLGGALPCTLTLQKLTCSGVSMDSDVTGMVKSMLDPIPGLMLPEFIKKIIYTVLDVGYAPLIDLLFGGVSKNTNA